MIFILINQFIHAIAGSWYTGDLKQLLDKALSTDDDVPHSAAFTINGEPGDLLPCSSGMFFLSYFCQ